MKEIIGRLVAQESKSEMRFAIVVSRFNELITKSLLEGATDCLLRLGIKDSAITVVKVPGAFEIPLVAQEMAQTKNYDAVICLGAVIKGATPHFEYVASSCTSSIAQIALNQKIPVIFGVLTTDTIEQAIERAGTKAGNKGYEAAQTAVEMVDILRQLRHS